MGNVYVTNWTALVDAIKSTKYTEPTNIIWQGSTKYIDYLEIPTGFTFGTAGVKGGSNISIRLCFYGLTIGTIRTTSTQTDGSHYVSKATDQNQGLYYGLVGNGLNGFSISDLTVENLVLSNPRDCFAKADFYNCYFDNIEVEENEKNDLYFQSFRRLNPDYYFECMPLGGIGYGCEKSVINVKTKDLPINVRDHMECCEYNINIDKIENPTKYNEEGFFIIPNRMKNCYISGNITKKDETQEDLTILFGGGANPITTNTVCAFHSDVKINVETNLFKWDDSAYWCWNVGSQSLKKQDNVPDSQLITIGDLRNPDILRSKNIDFLVDDGFRWEQYGNGFGGDERFRLNPRINGGVIFLPLYKYPYTPIPEDDGEVEDNNICVYDMHTQQHEFFNNNGLAVLHPTNCKVTEELNGGWRVTIEHPKDADGKWQYIREFNILKVLGQLYIIRKVIIRKSSVYANAEHISYHLNDYWIFPPFSIAGYKGQTLIDSIIAQMDDLWESRPTRYIFNITTDIDSVETFRDWYEIQDGHTPYEMLLGASGFIAKLNGELYRDNFSMSINHRMEKAKDNAFILHPDLNVTSIEKTVDLETFCTYFRAYDNFGGWYAVSWVPTGLERQYPHNIVRSQNFYYDEDYYDFDMLCRDGFAYFKQNCCPLISYRIQVKDLKRHKDYKQFINNFRFKVGDVGLVWDSDGSRWLELEITKTVKDGITGDCLEVTIGDARSFTRPNGYSVTFDRNYEVKVDPESGDAETQEEKKQDIGEDTDLTDYEFDEFGNVLRYIGTTKAVKMPKVDGKIITLNAFNFTEITELNVSEGIEVIE